jgi:hypothetical protein
MFTTECPNCFHRFEAPDDFSGKTVQCKTCQKTFTVQPVSGFTHRSLLMNRTASIVLIALLLICVSAFTGNGSKEPSRSEEPSRSRESSPNQGVDLRYVTLKEWHDAPAESKTSTALHWVRLGLDREGLLSDVPMSEQEEIAADMVKTIDLTYFHCPWYADNKAYASAAGTWSSQVERVRRKYGRK